MSAWAARRSGSYEKPVAIMARSSLSQPEARIGAPSRWAPAPRSALKHSPVTGLSTTPAASPWPSSSATLTAQAGKPYRKLTVPSSGSTIQRLPLAASLREPSSASRPSPGRSAASSSRTVRSASETGSVAEDLLSSPSGSRP